MSFIAVRSVSLSEETTNAWKEGGVTFSRRGRTANEVVAMGYDNVINLGNSRFRPEGRYSVWNHGDDIEALLYPGMTRELLDDLMPPQPSMDLEPHDVWIKRPGSHGRGKQRMIVDRNLVLPREWDWCQHVDGQEYRLITVGHRIVQDFLRHGENGDRTYEWVAMREVPRSLKDAVREAARRVPGRNIIAWDCIVTEGGQPYIFEGNTCPGVNIETVQRIVKEMNRQNEENNASSN